MKKLLILVILNIFLLGCELQSNDSDNNSDENKVVEGENEREIAACELVKEFALSRRSISDFSEIKCEFPDQETSDNSILISIELQDSDKEYYVLVVLEYEMFFDLEIKKTFQKNENGFEELSGEDLMEFKNLNGL